MYEEKKIPAIIWRLNFGGFAVLMLGLFGAMIFNKSQDKNLFWACVVVTAIGWFMTAIRVPLRYPHNLFAFSLYDLGMPVMFSLILIATLLIEISEGRLTISKASLFVFELWVALAICGVLMRVAARIGTRLAER